MEINEYLQHLKDAGDYRSIPLETKGEVVDFSTNDYMGIAADGELRERFFADPAARNLPMSSSASRLLASRQIDYFNLETFLRLLYGKYCGGDRAALLFNSGYHANTGLVSSLAADDTYIIADRLVHASIIDGIVLSRAPFTRFRHNDYSHLEQLIERHKDEKKKILVIVESVYSMDGDSADIERLIEIRRRYPQVMLYVDEAHAFGVRGPRGLGLVAASSAPQEVDVIVGTFGKAAGSMGAFAITSGSVREFLVNTARSFIFSTALPPMQAAWTRFALGALLSAERRRAHLQWLAEKLQKVLQKYSTAPIAVSHIQPLVIGDSRKVVELSHKLLNIYGLKALPIRRPTVPPGTERLRISLSASLNGREIEELDRALADLLPVVNNDNTRQ
jgi:putative 8-amino-7-oxononanoate synthase/2-amino-3-ketobutyrate coenzyme A ligase